MDKQYIEMLDELTLLANMELNILHNALKCNDEELDIGAVSYVVERIYNLSEEVRMLF